MKKILAILVCLLLVGSVALTALAANDTKVTVTADKTTVQRGDTVTITVSVSGSDPLTSIGYLQVRDSEYFTISKGVMQPALEESGSPTIKNFSKVSGLAVGGFMDYDTEEDIAVTINGDILVMTIAIRETAPFGSFKVTDLVKIKNRNSDVPFILAEDTITVVKEFEPCNHTYGAWTDAGDVHKQTCSLCGAENTTDHAWDTGKVTVAPTTETEGVKVFTCTQCGATKAEAVPALDAPSVTANTVFTVKADKTTVHRGDTVNIALSLNGTDSLTSFGYIPNNESLYYSIGKYALNKDVIQENGAASLMNFTKKNGLVVGGFTDWDTEADTAVTINGVILTFSITIRDDAPFGDFTVTKNIAINNNADSVLFDLAEDTITVVCEHANGSFTVVDDATHKLVCTECGTSSTFAHEWDEGTVTTVPTCKDTGTKIYTCICSSTKTETLPITNEHSFVDWRPDDGNTHSRSCTVCAKVETGNHSISRGVCTVCDWKVPYTITFLDENGAELSKATYHYGDTVTAPADPQKAADKTYTYTFAGWDKEVVAVTGDAIYTATYKATYIEYTVKFVYDDGTVIHEATYHYGDTVTIPADPQKDPATGGTYTFTGWDKEITSVTEDVTYTAQFIFEQTFPDFTQDEQITDADAIYLLRYTLFPEDYPMVGNGDVNCDGKITDADAIYLLRHTLFPEDYPLYPKKES